MKKFIIIIMAAVAPFVYSNEVSNELLDFVAECEGFRAEPYLCPSNILTIGYGFTNPDLVHKGFITETEARSLLRKKLVKEKSWVMSQIGDTKLTNNQIEALTSLVYNIGRGNFSESTLLKKLRKGDLVGARNEFPKWRRGNGKILPGLVKRRAQEIQLFWDKK